MKAIRTADLQAGTVANPLKRQLIVSLTSYPARFKDLHVVLRGLLAQSVKPDLIVLNLDYGDECLLPTSVRKLVGNSIKIITRAPIRSYGKLINTLRDYPEANIITVDDDMLYPSNLVAQLVKGAERNEGSIVCARAHRLSINPDGFLLPYISWPFNVRDDFARKPSIDLMPTGVGGVLYPAHSLHQRIFDMETALRICPTADDIWFYWMARLAGTKHVVVGDPVGFRTVGSQESGLFHENWHGANDRQIRAVWRELGAPNGLEDRLQLPPETDQ